jgi:glycosyltransferase involved in cell wall biosynthesis
VRIGIVAPSPVPLTIGGAERLWWGLLDHINGDTPHDADLIKLPGPERNFWEVVDSYRRFSELDVSEFDLVISGKYPAWMVRHDNHVCYMLHPLRGLYDTYPALPESYETADPRIRGLVDYIGRREGERAALPELFERLGELRSASDVAEDAYQFPGPLIRRIVHFLDGIALAPNAISRYCALSHTVAGRAGYFPPGHEVHVAYPSPQLRGFRGGRGRYLLTVSRLDGPKRIDLVVQAMRHVRTDVELRIVGTGPAEPHLRELAAGDPRISFLGYVNDDGLIDLYAGARAVLFVPYDEDFGYIAVEAMLSGKPVITATDSGGPTELIEDGVSGLIAPPEPAALGARIEQLLHHPLRARRIGRMGRERAARIGWALSVPVILGEAA